MRKTLLLLFTVACLPAFAQIVNIPDATFKTELLSTNTQGIGLVKAYNSTGNAIKIDANNDNEIQASEAQSVWRLSVDTYTINDLTGISAFTNIRKLLVLTNATSLNLTALTHLEELDCSSMPHLSTLNIAGLTSLKNLNCSGTEVTALALQGMVNLQKLDTHYCPITNLDLSGLSALQEAQVYHMYVETLTLQGNSNLKKLYCQYHFLQTLNVAEAPLLEDLKCQEGTLTSLAFASMPHLKYIDCTNNAIGPSIDLSENTELITAFFTENPADILTTGDLPVLQALYLNWSGLDEVELGYLPSLQTLDMSGAHVASLNTAGCPALTNLNINLTYLSYLNIKNGSILTTFSAQSLSSASLSICVDEGEELSISDYFTQLGQQPNITTYCSSEPGGNHNTISGITSFNNNNSCTGGLPAIRFAISNGNISNSVIGNNAGSYSFFPLAGTFTITPQLENNSWFTISPSTATVTFADANNNTATQNFCISPNGNHPDVEIMVSPIINAQPGFDALYRITYKNKGNQTVSGDVVFAFDDSRTDFVYATVTPNSTAPGSLSWDYTNLQPFESRSVMVTLNMNGPMETPALNNGDHLAFTASITPTGADETPTDNTFSLGQTLTGSFDPNDITCLEGDTEHPDNIGKYLHYNINFENTGTAPATFIVVKDMIDTAKFDISSLQLINASHDVKTRINGNKVEFYFDAINLGPNQKGNVMFKIKTLPTLSVNTSVTQNANIYFDYNWPITTNDATTTFQLLSRGDFAQDMSVKIYPNPSSSVVNITAATPISSLQLYDLQGRLLEAVSPKLNETTVDISQRTNGIYFLKISTENGVKVKKLVKQ